MRPAPEPRRLTLKEIGPRVFETIEPGGCYRRSIPAIGDARGGPVVVEDQELTGELLARCDLLGTEAIDGVLSVATFNLSSARRERTGEPPGGESEGVEIPRSAVVEELCQRVLAAERTGEPAIALRDSATQSGRPTPSVFGSNCRGITRRSCSATRQRETLSRAAPPGSARRRRLSDPVLR